LGTLSPWSLHVATSSSALSLIEEGVAAYQDEAAQLAVLALDPRPGEVILDACAGRGGKSAAILSSTNSMAEEKAVTLLHATDTSSSKLERLVFELAKQGLTATTEVCDLKVSVPSAAGPFDKIIVDAPCSGSGTLGRRPEIRRRLTESAVKELTAVQAAILNHAASVLKQGGRLVFVVCSLLEVEGFGQEDCFLNAHPDFFLVRNPPSTWPPKIPWAEGRILIDPSVHRTDGYQFLVFEKKK
jgi:16S rRNA (cytosine967-C5)-methyltransferase